MNSDEGAGRKKGAAKGILGQSRMFSIHWRSVSFTENVLPLGPLSARTALLVAVFVHDAVAICLMPKI
jgi:hypothetical protein